MPRVKHFSALVLHAVVDVTAMSRFIIHLPSARMRSEGYGTQFVCVCVSVPLLTATPLTYGYKVRYESKANMVLKVCDSWILLKILCSKVTALFAHHKRF